MDLKAYSKRPPIVQCWASEKCSPNAVLGSTSTVQPLTALISKDNRVKLKGRVDPYAEIIACIENQDINVRINLIRGKGYTGAGIKIGVIEQARSITALHIARAYKQRAYTSFYKWGVGVARKQTDLQ